MMPPSRAYCSDVRVYTDWLANGHHPRANGYLGCHAHFFKDFGDMQVTISLSLSLSLSLLSPSLMPSHTTAIQAYNALHHLMAGYRVTFNKPASALEQGLEFDQHSQQYVDPRMNRIADGLRAVAYLPQN